MEVSPVVLSLIALIVVGFIIGHHFFMIELCKKGGHDSDSDSDDELPKASTTNATSTPPLVTSEESNKTFAPNRSFHAMYSRSMKHAKPRRMHVFTQCDNRK